MHFSNLSIPLEELPNFEAAELNAIAQRYRIVLWINFLVSSVFFLTLVLGAYWLIEGMPQLILWLVIAVVSIIFILRAIEIYKGFRRRKFGVRALDIIFQKGFFYFTETVIPFKRIQHVEIKQGPILRIFNLYSLKLYTAGASSGDLVINGLDKDVAEKLKAKVLQVTEEEDE